MPQTDIIMAQNYHSTANILDAANSIIEHNDERKEIKDSLCYLRLVGTDDDLAFNRVINVPSRKIGKKAMEGISTVAEECGCSLFEALRQLSQPKTYAN